MAGLFPVYCDSCVKVQPHVKFEAEMKVVYVCNVCKAISIGKTLADLMVGAKSVGSSSNL